MAKLTLQSLLSGFGFLSKYNANSDAIETAFENTLSRDGSTPNAMEADLDMGGHRLSNVADAISNSDVITLGQALSGIVVVDSVALTQDNVADILGPLTTLEGAAGLLDADINTLWPEGYYKRYLLTGNGSTDDSARLAKMLAVGKQGVALNFGYNTSFVTVPLVLSAANNNIPKAMIGYGVTFKAKAGSSGVFVTLTNPHSVWEGFKIEGSFVFDANGLCTSAFLLSGSQRCFYGPCRFINAVGGPQCRVEGAAATGVYYNTFMQWIAGGLTANGGDDDGFSIKSTDGSNRVASNTWISPRSSWNVGHGYDIDRCSDTFVGPEAEKNDGSGFNIDNTVGITISGGHSENNAQAESDGGAGDATTDVSFTLTANSTRVMIFGGRHFGAIDGEELGSGHVLLPCDSGGVTLGLGLAFGGASMVVNKINFVNTSDAGFMASGANKLRWVQATDILQSHVKHLMGGELEIDGDINHDGSNAGFFGKAPAAQPADMVALTDSSGGTADNTVALIPTLTDTPATADALRDDINANLYPVLKNNFADLAAKINAIRTALRALGLMA